jgi:hypothetical protein
MPQRIFLLSPASLAGKRAERLLREGAAGELARALRAGGLTVADVFEHTSSLYFRGKRAYARAFAAAPPGVEGAWVITTDRGLVPMDTPVTPSILREMASVPIDPAEPRYRGPLVASALDLRDRAGPACEAVLLGSLATAKYLDPLREAWGDALVVPEAFVGRGDMSRGGLMLRAVADRSELTYMVARGPMAGTRPPRLERRNARGGR